MSSTIVPSSTIHTDLTSVHVVPNTPSIRSIKLKKMSILDNIIFCAALCLVAGVAIASQGAINAKLGAYSGQGLSSVIVFSTGEFLFLSLPFPHSAILLITLWASHNFFGTYILISPSFFLVAH